MWTSLHGFTGLLTVVLSVWANVRLLTTGAMMGRTEFCVAYVVWVVNTVGIWPFVRKLAGVKPRQWYWLIQFVAGAASNVFSLAAIGWCADTVSGHPGQTPPIALQLLFLVAGLLYFLMGCADYDTGDLGIPFIATVVIYILIYLPIVGVVTGASGWINPKIAMDAHMLMLSSNGYAFFAATLHKKRLVHENRSFLWMGAFMVVSYALILLHEMPMGLKALGILGTVLPTYVLDVLVKGTWIYDFKRTNKLRMNLHRWSFGKILKIILWHALIAVPLYCTISGTWSPRDRLVATVLLGIGIGTVNLVDQPKPKPKPTGEATVEPLIHQNVHTSTGVSLAVHAFAQTSSPFPWSADEFRQRVTSLLRKHAPLRLGLDVKTQRMREVENVDALGITYVAALDEEPASWLRTCLSELDQELLFESEGPRFEVVVYQTDRAYLCVILYDHLIADAQTWTWFWKELHEMSSISSQEEALNATPFHELHSVLAERKVPLLKMYGKLRLPHRIAMMSHDEQFALSHSRYSQCSTEKLEALQKQFSAWGGNLTSGLLACVLKGFQTTRPYFRVVIAVDLRRYLSEVKGYGNFAAAISLDVPASDVQYELPHLVSVLHQKIVAGIRDRTYLDDAHLVQSMESKNVEFGHRFGLDRVSVAFSNLGIVAVPCDAMLWGALTEAPTCCCTLSTIEGKGCTMLANIDFERVQRDLERAASQSQPFPT